MRVGIAKRSTEQPESFVLITRPGGPTDSEYHYLMKVDADLTLGRMVNACKIGWRTKADTEKMKISVELHQ